MICHVQLPKLDAWAHCHVSVFSQGKPVLAKTCESKMVVRMMQSDRSHARLYRFLLMFSLRQTHWSPLCDFFVAQGVPSSCPNEVFCSLRSIVFTFGRLVRNRASHPSVLIDVSQILVCGRSGCSQNAPARNLATSCIVCNLTA